MRVRVRKADADESEGEDESEDEDEWDIPEQAQLYETPNEYTHALVSFLKENASEYQTIYDPAMGRGAILEYFERYLLFSVGGILFTYYYNALCIATDIPSLEATSTPLIAPTISCQTNHWRSVATICWLSTRRSPKRRISSAGRSKQASHLPS